MLFCLRFRSAFSFGRTFSLTNGFLLPDASRRIELAAEPLDIVVIFLGVFFGSPFREHLAHFHEGPDAAVFWRRSISAVYDFENVINFTLF